MSTDTDRVETGRNVHRYTGTRVPSDGNGRPYVPSGELIKVVNMAIVLGRPLLVMGPPGCGKTCLAEAVAHELGLELFAWHITSASRCQDGLYRIDMIRRLQDAHLPGKKKAQSIFNYLTFGALGKAIRCAKGSVLLIDEIDKADIDFPNDLLNVIESLSFTIEEADEEDLEKSGWERSYYATGHRPIVIVTSNDEKELPEAFLRRCIFHYIEFPDSARLRSIVRLHAAGLEHTVSEELISGATDQMLKMRVITDIKKKPSTSELIDWLRILSSFGIGPEMIQDRTQLVNETHWHVLFKHHSDIVSAKAWMESQS